MTIGSFAVRAVGPHGQQLANVAAISTGPAAALDLLQRTQTFPAGTRFHVRGGAPRRAHDYAGERISGSWLDEWGHIEHFDRYTLPDDMGPDGFRGTIRRFDEDPDEALAEYRGDTRLALVIALLIGGIAALQALRWMLS